MGDMWTAASDRDYYGNPWWMEGDEEPPCECGARADEPCFDDCQRLRKKEQPDAA